MAAKTETRVIKIDVNATEAAKATKKLNAHMKRLNRSATSVTESIFRFQMGMQALASFLAVREIADLADKYTILQSRLKLVIKSQEDLVVVQRDLNALASDVFTDVGSIAKAYTDLQLKIKGVRLTHQDTIKVVRTMAQSFRVSGSTAKEASSSTLQLMQALSSGKLQGDELRTLRESNILLLDAIVEQYRRVNNLQKDAKLNIKELGAEGKITPEIILDALKKSAPKFEAQAKKLSLTFENIFVVASNKLAAFLGQLEAQGKLKPLKDGMLGLAKAADSAAVAFGTFVALFAAAKVISGIKAMAAALMSLRVALSTPVLAGLTVALGGVVGLMYELSKGTTTVNGVVYRTIDLWTSMASVLMNDISKSVTKVQQDITKLTDALDPLIWLISLPMKFLVGTLDFGSRAVVAWTQITKKLKNLFVSFGVSVVDGILEAVSMKYENKEDGPFSIFGWAMSKLNAAKNKLVGVVEENPAIKKSIPKSFEEESKTLVKDLKEIWQTLTKGIFEGPKQDIKEKGKEIEAEFMNVLQRAAALTKPYEQEFKDIETKSSQNVKTRVENLHTFIKDGLNKYIDDIKDWGKQVTDMANKTMKSFEDAIVKAVTTGKLQFKDLADSILQDLARIMVRQHISGPIAQALASAFSPTPTTNKTVSAPIPQVKTPSPTIALTPPVFGGAMPPFMDSPGVSQVSSMRPSISAPRIMVPQQKTNVSIQNFSGQQAQVSETVSADGSKNIKVTIGQVVKEGLAAGQYDRVLSGAFGINRKGSR